MKVAVKRFALIAWLLVIGTALAVLPWSIFWPRAAFLPAWLAPLYAHPITRGVISGIGLVVLLAGLMELHHATSRHR